MGPLSKWNVADLNWDGLVQKKNVKYLINCFYFHFLKGWYFGCVELNKILLKLISPVHMTKLIHLKLVNFMICRLIMGNFPGGALGKILLWQCRGHGFGCGPGKIHMLRSNWDRTHSCWSHVLQLLKPEPPRARCSVTREGAAVRIPSTTWRSSPCSPQLEKVRCNQRNTRAKQQRASAAKIINK